VVSEPSRSVAEEVALRVDRLRLPFNAGGYDPFGVSRDALRTSMRWLGWLYRHYFRVSCQGLGHLPQTGRAMLVGNHSGGYAIDAGMVIAACFFELDPPRLAHGMADRFLNRLPFASRMASRSGQLTGSPEQARRLLADDRLLLVFPEGALGTAKLFRDRYTLRPFTTGFARLALEMQAPVIPFAFFGGGEAVPTVANLVRLGKLLGLPYLPVTPYLLPLPLPVRAQIRFGAPLRLEGTGSERREVLELQVQRVRDAVDGLLQSRLHSDRDPGGGSAP
jgi:1-acyl-sn-glycerol-3-phosphate acyltransferase